MSAEARFNLFYDSWLHTFVKKGIARELGKAEAEDLAQDALLKCWLGRDWSAEPPAAAWMHTVWNSARIDRFRQQSRRGASVPLDESMEPSAQELSPESVVLHQERKQLKERILDGLDKRDRMLIETLAEGGRLPPKEPGRMNPSLERTRLLEKLKKQYGHLRRSF